MQPIVEAATLSYSRYHIVEKGESLWEIGKQYGVAISAIKSKNNLRTDTIYPKQKLIIPVTINGVYHPVTEGETLWRICNTYSVGVEEVVLLNRLADADCIVPGQKIFIPGAKSVREVIIPRQETAVAKEKPRPPAAVNPVQPVEGELQPQESAFAVWPLDEVAAYRESGFGIDIAASGNLTVKSVASGKVVGEGDLRQFGTRTLSVIAVEHAGMDVYTVYMYNGVSLVSTGEAVEESQPIAMLEATDLEDDIILHFEVRQLPDAEPVDPLDYLP